MIDLDSYLWLARLIAAAAGILVLAKVVLPLASMGAHMLVRRYFRFLVPASHASRDEIGEYAAEARVLALAERFEFVDVYRPFRGPWLGRRVEIWRAEDFRTIALVSESPAEIPTLNETIFYSALDNGKRLTTTDNVRVSDPRGLRGVLARPGATFRELYRTHLARMRSHNAGSVVMGKSDPVAAIEDLDREHVQKLVDAGLARYRNDRQTAWSYTLRGGYEVYYLARPKIVRIAPKRPGHAVE
jgi:hypothetical protein